MAGNWLPSRRPTDPLRISIVRVVGALDDIASGLDRLALRHLNNDRKRDELWALADTATAAIVEFVGEVEPRSLDLAKTILLELESLPVHERAPRLAEWLRIAAETRMRANLVREAAALEDLAPSLEFES